MKSSYGAFQDLEKLHSPDTIVCYSSTNQYSGVGLIRVGDLMISEKDGARHVTLSIGNESVRYLRSTLVNIYV